MVARRNCSIRSSNSSSSSSSHRGQHRKKRWTHQHFMVIHKWGFMCVCVMWKMEKWKFEYMTVTRSSFADRTETNVILAKQFIVLKKVFFTYYHHHYYYYSYVCFFSVCVLLRFSQWTWITAVGWSVANDFELSRKELVQLFIWHIIHMSAGRCYFALCVSFFYIVDPSQCSLPFFWVLSLAPSSYLIYVYASTGTYIYFLYPTTHSFILSSIFFSADSSFVDKRFWCPL